MNDVFAVFSVCACSPLKPPQHENVSNFMFLGFLRGRFSPETQNRGIFRRGQEHKPLANRIEHVFFKNRDVHVFLLDMNFCDHYMLL